MTPRAAAVSPAERNPAEGNRAGAAAITVAIPTYGREQVLLDTVAAVLALQPPPQEVLVLDQTPRHEPATAERLAGWDAAGAVRWLRLPRPSIPAAMNRALVEARSPVVLFLDDDVIPHAGLIAAHLRNHADGAVHAVVGQVLQPGQEPDAAAARPTGTGLRQDLGFPFHSTRRCEVANCMAGNLSVRRDFARQIGGFDENFVGVAHRFETEFARRLRQEGGTLVFDPAASIRHLQAPRGGTRAYGNHLRSARPEHGVGDYYFAFRSASGAEARRYALRRFFREVRTRYHLAHPWWIPVKLLGELRALLWARRLAARGPRYLSMPSEKVR